MNGIEEKAEKEKGQNLLPNIYAFETRCSLYRGDRARVTEWMENAPDENVEFRIYDRFIYLTKVRVYLQSGRNEQAYSLLTKLKYYAEMMSRTYIGMECGVLMAIALQRLKMMTGKGNVPCYGYCDGIQLYKGYIQRRCGSEHSYKYMWMESRERWC